MDVRGNISFGMEMRRVPKAGQEAKITQVARMLQMEHLLDRKPDQLSGGQRRRVAVAAMFCICRLSKPCGLTWTRK